MTRAVADEDLQTPDFTGAVVQMMQDALPLLAYGWEIVDAAPARG